MTNDNFSRQKAWDISIDSDPVAHLLVKRFRFEHPWQLGMASAIGACIVAAIVMLYRFLNHMLDFSFISTGKVIAYWFPIVLWWLLIGPILYYYYLWSFTAVTGVIEKLQQSKVIQSFDNNQSSIDEIRYLFYRFYSHSLWLKWMRLFAALVAVCIGILVFILPFKNEIYNPTALPRLFISLPAIAIAYCGLILASNLIANIQILFFLFNKQRTKIKINPLHPDRCGGLSPLSAYSLKTAYLAAPLGLWVGILEMKIVRSQEMPEYFHFVIILYICLSLTVFFGPLAAAHQQMRNAKDEQLSRIADQYLDDYPSVFEHMEADSANLDERIKKLEALRRFYSITDEFPVWPFDAKKVRSYMFSASTPLLPLIGNLVGQLIKSVMISLNTIV